MRLFIILLGLFTSVLFSSQDIQKEREMRIERNIQKAIELEEKYAKEQIFYDEKNYDFNSSKVDEESLKHIPALEPEYDLDIDDAYD